MAGQIMIPKKTPGTVSTGLFVAVLASFALGAIHPGFALLAIPSILGGGIVAALLLRRRPSTPSIRPGERETSSMA